MSNKKQSAKLAKMNFEDNAARNPLGNGEGVDDIYKTTASPRYTGISPKHKGGKQLKPVGLCRGDRPSNLTRSLAARKLSVTQLRDSIGSLFNERRGEGSSDFDLRASLSKKCDEFRQSVVSRNSTAPETSFDLSSLNYLFEEDEKNNDQRRNSGKSYVRLSMFGTDLEEQLKLMDSFSAVQEDQRLAESWSEVQSDMEHGENFGALLSNHKLEESSSSLQTEESSQSTTFCDPAHQETKEPIMIEVTPHLSLPLRNSRHTYQAILDGRVLVTECCNCASELTVIEDVELVLCSDCFVLSPLEAHNSSSDDELEQTIRHTSSVAIGIKPNDIMSWLSEQEEQ